MSVALQNLNFIVSLTDRMSAPMGNILRTVNSVRNNMRQGAVDIGVGVAGLFTVGESVNKLTEKAIKFESAMADIRKVVDFPSPTGVKDFGNELLKMSHTTPITAEGLAQIAASGGQLGIAANDLPDFTDIVAKMSTAFGLLPEEAGKNIAKLSNIFKMPIADMRLMGDALNHLDDNMATNAKDIIDVTSNIGGMAQMMGLTATQSAALATSMLSLGQAPDVAATGINALLLKLGSASNQSKDFKAALGDIGLSVGDLENSLKNSGAQTTITNFLEKIGKLDKAQQLKTLGNLFGAEYADNLATLVGGLDQYHKALVLVAKQESFMGSMQREFAIRSATTENRLKILGNVWDHFLINAGTIFLPMVNDGIQLMNSLLDPVISSINKLSAEYPVLTKYLGYATAGVFAFIAIISIASIAMGALSLVSGGFALVMALITSPVFAVIAAFVAMNFAIDYVVENWKQLKQSFFDGANAFLDYIGVFSAIDTVTAKLNSLKAWWAGFDPFADMKAGAMATLSWLSNLDLFGSMKSGTVSIGDGLLSGIAAIKTGLLDFTIWLSEINPFGSLNFGAVSIGDGLLSGIAAIKTGLLDFTIWLSEINPFGSLNFGTVSIGDGLLSGIAAIKTGLLDFTIWLSEINPFGSLNFGAVSIGDGLLSGIAAIKTGLLDFTIWLSEINPFSSLNFGTVSIGDGLLSGIAAIKTGLLDFTIWLSEINPFSSLNFGAVSIGDGLLSGIAAIKTGLLDFTIWLSEINIFGSLSFGIITVINWVLSGVLSIQNSWLNAKLWLSTLDPFSALAIGAVAVVNWVLSGIQSIQNGWMNAKLWLAGLNPFGVLLAGAASVVASIVAALDRIKGWWSGFKGWLAGLNPFAGIASSLNGLMAKVAGIGNMKISIPSVIGGGSGQAGAKSGLLKQVSSSISNSSSSHKNTSITVHNHGSPMSGAKLANEMAMAGG